MEEEKEEWAPEYEGKLAVLLKLYLWNGQNLFLSY